MSKGKKQQQVKNVHENKYANEAENKGPKPAEMEIEHPGWMDEQCKKAVEKRDGIRLVPPITSLPRLFSYDPAYRSSEDDVERYLRDVGRVEPH